MIVRTSFQFSVASIGIGFLFLTPCVWADELPPPLFRFASQWVKEHGEKSAPSSHLPRLPTSENERSMTCKSSDNDLIKRLAATQRQLLIEQQNTKYLNNSIALNQKRQRICELTALDREFLKKKIKEMQDQQFLPRANQEQSASVKYQQMLKALEDENTLLIGKEKQSAEALSKEKLQTDHLSELLSAARDNIYRLQLEKKSISVTEDVKNATHPCFTNLNRKHQEEKIDELQTQKCLPFIRKGQESETKYGLMQKNIVEKNNEEKQTSEAISKIKMLAEHFYERLYIARNDLKLLQLQNKAMTLKVDLQDARLASLSDLTRNNLKLREKLIKSKNMEKQASRELQMLRAQLAKKAGENDDSKKDETDLTKGLGLNKIEDIASDNASHMQYLEDYSAGVAFGKEAINAISMNSMLGIKVNSKSVTNGFIDALMQKIKYSEKVLNDALQRRSLEVNQTRTTVIKQQKYRGNLALLAFKKLTGVRYDEAGFWYRTNIPRASPLSADSIISATVSESLAGGTIIKDGITLRQRVKEFPPLFRNVIAKLKLHGTATFLVPPELSYGDDGLPPHIPPGSTMMYTLTITGEENSDSSDKKVLDTGSYYLNKFTHESGVKKSPSGFWYKIIESGNGSKIHANDTVTTVIRESLTNGRVINDMIAQKKAIRLEAKKYPAIFREAIFLLSKYGSIKLVVPPDLAYGDKNTPSDIPPSSTMVYDIRVIDVKSDNK